MLVTRYFSAGNSGGGHFVTKTVSQLGLKPTNPELPVLHSTDRAFILDLLCFDTCTLLINIDVDITQCCNVPVDPTCAPFYPWLSSPDLPAESSFPSALYTDTYKVTLYTITTSQTKGVFASLI